MEVPDIQFTRSGDVDGARLLLGGEQTFADRGDHVLKGIDGSWRFYQPACSIGPRANGGGRAAQRPVVSRTE